MIDTEMQLNKIEAAKKELFDAATKYVYADPISGTTDDEEREAVMLAAEHKLLIAAMKYAQANLSLTDWM
jgi:hypothetical protein